MDNLTHNIMRMHQPQQTHAAPKYFKPTIIQNNPPVRALNFPQSMSQQPQNHDNKVEAVPQIIKEETAGLHAQNQLLNLLINLLDTSNLSSQQLLLQTQQQPMYGQTTFNQIAPVKLIREHGSPSTNSSESKFEQDLVYGSLSRVHNTQNHPVLTKELSLPQQEESINQAIVCQTDDEEHSQIEKHHLERQSQLGCTTAEHSLSYPCQKELRNTKHNVKFPGSKANKQQTHHIHQSIKTKVIKKTKQANQYSRLQTVRAQLTEEESDQCSQADDLAQIDTKTFDGIPLEWHETVKIKNPQTQRVKLVFKCKYAGCSSVFNKSCNLRDHFRKHTGLRPFKCQHCLKTFTQSGNLGRHLKNVHQITRQDQQLNTLKQDTSNSDVNETENEDMKDLSIADQTQ